MFGQVQIALLLCFSLTILSAGCRRVYTFAPVEGTVTKNGKPLSRIQVIFLTDPEAGAEGPRSIGTTDESGHYRLHTEIGNEGAVVGKHRVCVAELPPLGVYPGMRPRKDSAFSKLDDGVIPRGIPKPEDSRVPAIYSSVHETPLRAEVRAGGLQTINFDIP